MPHCRDSRETITLRHGLRPGDQGMIVHLHGLLYAEEYGLDTTFEPYVARPLADFALSGPGAGRIWLAERPRPDGSPEIVGSIAIVKAEPGAGQLRWFLLLPAARGQGHGRRLMSAALDYCRSEGLRSVYLWTFAELSAAIHLYQRHGFVETASQSHEIWGARRHELRFDLALPP